MDASGLSFFGEACTHLRLQHCAARMQLTLEATCRRMPSHRSLLEHRARP
jgi:hypothetical protein